jgi:soluble lytic murein transglycosylase-like protein
MPNSRKGAHDGHSRGHAHGHAHGHHGNGHHHRKHARKHRRRRHARNLVLAATALLAGHHGKPAKPKITTSITSYATRPTFSAGVTVRPDPKVFEPIIQEAADKHGLDPALIRGVMRFESAFQPMAVSSAGAIGLMQLMPEVAKELGVKDIFDPYENIMAGARYLRELLDRHNGKVDLALASYNAGPGAVARYNGVPPYRETRNYVKGITQFLRRNRTSTEKP